MKREKKYYTALDIGTSKICAIIAEKNDNDKLKIIGFSETESEGVSEGMIQNLIKASKNYINHVQILFLKKLNELLMLLRMLVHQIQNYLV